ncbi:tyrosine-type recombinase/integrase [Deinococcus yavapaiensis]|uniref:Integrase n=1 Tax=Deinococcus yavapaiensis KR-236 TaxID=694435 RepID=A0A318SEF6_9DEIO|nr:site-specific integrase [Deinococcus yavapaiensis]PYE55481.1 integrase [Deinococcus yavapaiensis KR-236]
MTDQADRKRRERERGNGLGSVRKLPSGKWQWSLTVGFDERGKQRRKSGTAPNETAAKKALATAMAAQAKGLLASPDRITLGEWLGRWLEGRKPHVSETTYELYATRLRLYVPENLKMLRLQTVKRTHLRDLETFLASKNLAASGRAKVFEHLRAAFDEAIEQELLAVNPARGIRVKATEAEKSVKSERRKALTDDELDRFLTAAEDDALYPLFYTLFSLGLRRGEALGLRWQDVNFHTGAIRVEQQVKLLRNKPVIGPLKTAGSRRTLYGSADLLDVLGERQAKQQHDRAALGEAWQECGLIFTTALGTLMHPRNVNRSIDRLCKRAGIRHFGSHAGRYTNITHRLRGGEKLEVVSAIAGHARPSITSDLYRDVMEDEKRLSVYSLKNQRQQSR